MSGNRDKYPKKQGITHFRNEYANNKNAKKTEMSAEKK